MRRVCMFSGGAGSWAAAKRVADKYGTDGLVLLFADTKMEDADLYRFLGEASANIGGELVMIADGRTIWEVFHDHKFLGNARVDLCSRILKREPCDHWLKANCDPGDTVVYVGIDWTESHRFTRLAERKLPWRYEAPLCEEPYISRTDVFAWLAEEGLRRPRLYDYGFEHNNCGGGSVKAGIGHFTNLFKALPEVYEMWEREEQRLRKQLGHVAILTDRHAGRRVPLSLAQLRERITRGEQMDMFDIGGCGCFIDDDLAAG